MALITAGARVNVLVPKKLTTHDRVRSSRLSVVSELSLSGAKSHGSREQQPPASESRCKSLRRFRESRLSIRRRRMGDEYGQCSVPRPASCLRVAPRRRRGRWAMPHNNSSALAALKANILGGAIFLIPGFLAVWVLAKVFGLMRKLASSVGSTLGIEMPLGGVLLDIVAVAAVVLLCYLAGLIAERAAAQRIRSKLDDALLGSFPGYAFVKGLAENITTKRGGRQQFHTCLGDNKRFLSSGF